MAVEVIDMIKLRQRDGGKAPEPMLSPMIDMIFLLLVFFIVSTMYMTEIKSVPIRLPVAQNSESVSKSDFTITLKKDGSLYLDEQKIALDQLVQNAVLSSKRDSNFSVIIRAEATVEYEKVIKLMDSLKGGGVTRFGLATDMGEQK